MNDSAWPSMSMQPFLSAVLVHCLPPHQDTLHGHRVGHRFEVWVPVGGELDDTLSCITPCILYSQHKISQCVSDWAEAQRSYFGWELWGR
jgi:hypothetical protein